MKLADSIEVVRRLKRKMQPPDSKDDAAFEKTLRGFPPRVRSVIQVGLGLGLRSEELLAWSAQCSSRPRAGPSHGHWQGSRSACLTAPA